jgi:hypothetical protein
MWVGACGWACSSARQENFVGIAFRHRWEHHERFGLDFLRAFAGVDAFTSGITKVSFHASASGFADSWAQWIGILARTIATFALTIFFVGIAGGNRWENQKRFWLSLRRAFAGHNAFSVIVFSEISFFASAARNADTWAHGVGSFAGAVASFALTVFFVFTTHLGLDGHGFDGWHAASFRMNAVAVFFVSQKSRFAKATDDAIASAWFIFGMRVVAGGRASGSASHEHLVFFALRNLWWISEELHGFLGIALDGWHAHATSIPQMTFIAEASDDALFGANRAWIGIGAGGSACGAAGIEKFIVRAFGFGLRELHGDFVMTGLAFFEAHTFTVGVLQVSLFAETTDHTLEGTHYRCLGVGTIGCASGSACQKFGIRTAFLFGGKSRGGDSEPEGTNAEQQHVS